MDQNRDMTKPNMIVWRKNKRPKYRGKGASSLPCLNIVPPPHQMSSYVVVKS